MSKPTMTPEEEDARYERSIKPVTDSTLCQARILVDRDTRFKPAVYSEDQCKNKPAEGDDLCKRCRKRFEAWVATPCVGSGAHWNNRITEAPHGGVHVLGTDWAIAKVKWVG